MSKESEARQLLEQANRKVNEFNLFGMFGSRQSKCEEAADLCLQAGHLFKIEKRWRDAGDAYAKAAEYVLQTDDRDSAANHLVEASKCLKKSHPEEAIRMLQRAVDMLKERGRFHPAANYQKQIAEVYESDLVDVEQAMGSYEEAAELYSGEDASGLANQCWLKVATFAGQLEQWPKAVEKFEHVATSSLDNNLTKYSAKLYFLNAGLCHLASDVVSARRALERYQDMDMTFAQTREGQLLAQVIEAVEAGDQQRFTDVVAEYDRMSKLDGWKTTVLLKIKKQIAEEPSLT